MFLYKKHVYLYHILTDVFDKFLNVLTVFEGVLIGILMIFLIGDCSDLEYLDFGTIFETLISYFKISYSKFCDDDDHDMGLDMDMVCMCWICSNINININIITMIILKIIYIQKSIINRCFCP